MRSRLRPMGAGILGASLLALALPVLAQVVTVTHPSNLTRLDVASETLLQDSNGDWWVSPGGRFVLYTGSNTPPGRGGNPTVIGDENKRIASKNYVPYSPFSAQWQAAWTSGFLVAVDPDDPDNAQFIDPFQLALDQAPSDDLNDLQKFWSQPISGGPRDAVGTARIPIEFDANDNPIGYVIIRTEYTLVGDALQIAITVENQGRVSHNFGLRVVIDAGFDKVTGPNDGQPIFLPDGTVITSERVIEKAITPLTEGNCTWVSYDPKNPLLAIRGFVGTDSTKEVWNRGTATFAAGPPDRIEFGQLRNMGLGQWVFTPNPNAPLLGMDVGYAVRWNATTLAPGQSKRFVTWYGVGSSTPSYDAPFAMMAYVPMRLKAQANELGGYDIVDLQGRTPFPVYVYIDNFGPSPLLNATARVRLPYGFELAAGAPQVNLGIIPHDGLASAQWDVTATATRPGRAVFKFTGPEGRVLNSTVDIPVLPVLNPLPSTYPAFEMVSFPFVFGNKSAAHVLASLGDLHPGGPATIVRYDPTEPNPNLRYKFYPDPFASVIEPGNGYWMLNLNSVPVVMPDDRLDVSSTSAFNLVVRAGWNQIGDPFQYTIDLWDIEVMDFSGNRYSMEEAVNRGMLLPTLFWWDPYEHRYKWEENPQKVTADPYMGYWLLAYRDLVLLIPPPVYQWTTGARASSEGAVPAEAGWRLTMLAQTPAAASEAIRVGVAPDARDGWDKYDRPCPPEPVSVQRARVQAWVIGPETTPCLADIRSQSAGRQEWVLTVRTNQLSAPVTLTWPDLSSLPKELVPTLIDLETGARRHMRTTASYSFTSSPFGAPRQFQIIVQERSSLGPMVTAAQATATGKGGAAISYTLAAPANVTVTVRNIAGRTVRVLLADRLQDAGPNQVIWNGLSDSGAPVPAGRYIIQISARSAETGQSYQVVRTVQVVR